MTIEKAGEDRIHLYNRETRSIEIEQVPGRNLLSLAYSKPCSLILARGILSRTIFSRLYGWIFHQKFSSKQIDAFIEKYGIDMSEVQIPTGGFKTFNDFFIRKLKPGARPIAQDPDALIAPADSRLKIIELHKETILDIKGASLTLSQLLCRSAPLDTFNNGLCLQFRLAPCDYHRFGHIENGVAGPVQNIGGRLFSVNPLALKNMPAIWGQNFRNWCSIQTKHLGTIIQIEVGATMVGSIVQHQPLGGYCTRGGEKGYFQMGGSTVLIIVQPGMVRLDEDILNYSNKGIETLVRYGEKIGQYTEISSKNTK